MLVCDRCSGLDGQSVHKENPMLDVTVRIASTDEIYLRKNICGSCWKKLKLVITDFLLQKEVK